MSVRDILPRLPAQSIGLVLPKGMPKDRAEVVSNAAGGLPGAEIMLQKLLKIRAEIGGADKMIAERNDPVRQFHGAPVTYDGFGNASRTPPSSMVYVLA